MKFETAILCVYIRVYMYIFCSVDLLNVPEPQRSYKIVIEILAKEVTEIFKRHIDF